MDDRTAIDSMRVVAHILEADCELKSAYVAEDLSLPLGRVLGALRELIKLGIISKVRDGSGVYYGVLDAVRANSTQKETQ